MTAADLDRAARARLRTLSKDNADGVARHLVMAGRLLDEDPELAYAHAQAAVRRAGRVDVVREAAGLAAYRTGRYAEALRELRTVRRLNGSDEHLPVMADCERGLGRPERAIDLAGEESARTLGPEQQVELAIVVSGARLDMNEPEAAVATLRGPAATARGEQRIRVAEAMVAALEAAGRHDEAGRLRTSLPTPAEDDVIVFDLEDDVSDSVEAAGVDDDGASGDVAQGGASRGRRSAGDVAPLADESSGAELAGTASTGASEPDPGRRPASTPAAGTTPESGAPTDRAADGGSADEDGR